MREETSEPPTCGKEDDQKVLQATKKRFVFGPISAGKAQKGSIKQSSAIFLQYMTQKDPALASSNLNFNGVVVVVENLETKPLYS